NDTKVDMSYYLDMLKVYLQGVDPNAVSMMAGAVVGAIQNNLLIIQGAPGLGYTVEQSEIDAALKENSVPGRQAYRDLFASETLQGKLMENYFGAELPDDAEQVKVEAMVFEDEQIAMEALDRIDNGETFMDMARIYGVEQLTKELGGDLGWLPRGLTATVLGLIDASVLEKTAFSLNPGEISAPVYDAEVSKGIGYWILKVEEKDEDVSVHARAILLGSLEEAKGVKKELEEGADFAALAQKISQDEAHKQDGGDLGWLRKGFDETLLSNTAFTMAGGEISEPIHDVAVETKGGYWVVRVLEREDKRPLDADLRNSLLQDDFSTWISQQAEKSTVIESLSQEQINWAVNRTLKTPGS
ncbi:MAG TPA: peptidylprolyl isomerase, partial [Dehalococcoidia bacterium]|nr:peptidylprolyl isomerase [Dehalococcoidia bacterium]